MIGLVIVSHYDFAQSLLTAGEAVIGPIANALAIGILPHDDMEKRRNEIADAVKKVDAGHGVIIATDLFGGTPSNLAISCMRPGVEVVAGMNLPMLIRFGNARQDLLLDEAAIALKEAGQKYITRASELLGIGREVSEPKATIQDASSETEVAAVLRSVSNELGKLNAILKNQPRSAIIHGGIGHNLPPPILTFDDTETLETGEIAAQTSAVEIEKARPSANILKLCIAALKKVLRLLNQLASWAASKIDTFAENAAKSAGKAVGPLLVAGAMAASLSGTIAQLIEQLSAVIGM